MSGFGFWFEVDAKLCNHCDSPVSAGFQLSQKTCGYLNRLKIGFLSGL
jgi:hypothetical protein